MSKRHVVEISSEANALLNAMVSRTLRSRKDLVSMTVIKVSAWDGITQGLILDTVPKEAVASEVFWREAEEKLIQGLRRCREKYMAKGHEV